MWLLCIERLVWAKDCLSKGKLRHFIFSACVMFGHCILHIQLWTSETIESQGDDKVLECRQDYDVLVFFDLMVKQQNFMKNKSTAIPC